MSENASGIFGIFYYTPVFTENGFAHSVLNDQALKGSILFRKVYFSVDDISMFFLFFGLNLSLSVVNVRKKADFRMSFLSLIMFCRL